MPPLNESGMIPASESGLISDFWYNYKKIIKML